MRSLESQANDEFLFVSNQVTLSAIDEVETQISSFGISKKIANLGSIPINLPPLQKQLRRIPSTATPSRALSPPLPPELIELLPLSLRNIVTDEDVKQLKSQHFDCMSAECVDSAAFRASTGSSNYDYVINDLETDNEKVPLVIRAGDDSSFPTNLISLDDAIHGSKSDTVKSDSSISTTTSTMSSSSSLLNEKENGVDVHLKNYPIKTPCAINNSQEYVSRKLGKKSTITFTEAGINRSSYWKESQCREISGSTILNSRKNIHNLNYQHRTNKLFHDDLMKAHSPVTPTQPLRRYQVSIDNLEKYVAVDRHNGLIDVNKNDTLVRPSENRRNYEKSHYFTAFHSRKIRTNDLPIKSSKQESDGIYDNFQVFRKDLAAKESYSVNGQSPRPNRRNIHYPITNSGISSPFMTLSLQSILEVGKAESPLNVSCETCSYIAASNKRSRSCERSRFSPPGSPLFGRRSASPWRNRSGNVPLLQISEETFERPSQPFRAKLKSQNVFIDRKEIHPHNSKSVLIDNSWNPVDAHHLCRDKMLDPTFNFERQIRSFESSPRNLNDNKFSDIIQNNKEKGKLKKSNTFYKCVKNWLKKSQ